MIKGCKMLMACMMSAAILLSGCTGTNKAVANNTSVTNETESSDSKTKEAEAKKTETKNNQDSQMILAMNAPTTLNPLYNTQKNVQQSLYLIFNPLVNIEENGTISANIASSWMMNQNNTALTLTINSNIKWHDGTPLTTEDVIFSMQQIQKINDCPYKKAVENVLGFEKVDDTTMKVLYRQPFSGTLQTLFFPVIPKHIYDVPESNSLNILPVGSGPYRFKSMTPLKNIQLEANADYFKGAPRISQIEISIIPDEESSLHAFKQNLIDVVYTDITEWGKYANDKSSKAYEFSSNIYEFMGLNFNKVMFQNSNVRKALLYALDREKMVHLYYLDHAVLTDTPISPTSYLYDKTLKPQSYDKEKAKLLLTEEGYEQDSKTGLMTKNGIPFSFTLTVNAENKDRVKIASEIKRIYKEIGIEVIVEKLDKAGYLTKVQTKQYDAFLGGWQLAYATDLSFALHSSKVVSGQNYATYKSEKMDQLLQQAFMAPQNNMIGAYAKLQQLFVEENPYISLYFKKQVLIAKDKIAGEIKPSPLNVFANVEQWTLQ